MARQTNLLPMALAGGERRTRTEPSKYDDLAQSLMMKQAFTPEPIHSVGHGLTKMGQMALMGYLEGKRGRDEKRERERMAEALFGSGGGTGSTGKSKSSAAKLGSVLGGEKLEPEGGFVERVVSVESGGNPNAKNPRSSATGPGQFIESTWLDMLGEHRPDLAQGQSREELLALRSDPNLSREMTNAYGDQNAQFLESRGLPVNDATKYLAHFAGPGGAADVLSADPSAPVGSILGNQVVQANPFLADMTAGDLVQWAGNKMGSGGPQQPQQPRIEPAGGAMPQQPSIAPAASQPQQGPNWFVGEPGDRVLQMQGMGGEAAPQPQPAMGQPPAPQPQAIAPGQQAQMAPELAPQPMQQQAQQGAPEEQQPGWMAQYLEPQEMQALRQAYMSGNISDTDVLQYVNQKREAAQPQWEYKDGQWYQLGPQGPQPFGEPNIGQTDDLKEYQAAVAQGYEGSIQDWIMDQKKAGATNVTVGEDGSRLPNPPAGMSYAYNQDGSVVMERHPDTGHLRPVAVPIGGGPVEQERAEAEAQKQASQDVTGTAAQTVYEDSERILGVLDEWGHAAAGSAAGATDWLPEAPAGRLNNHIESVKGNVGIDSLLKIKASGAGLGHIPQAQLDMLASLLGRLSPRMHPDDLRYNVKRIQEIYADIVRKTGGDPKEIYQERQERLGGQDESAPNTTSTGVPWKVVD